MPRGPRSRRISVWPAPKAQGRWMEPPAEDRAGAWDGGGEGRARAHQGRKGLQLKVTAVAVPLPVFF